MVGGLLPLLGLHEYLVHVVHEDDCRYYNKRKCCDINLIQCKPDTGAAAWAGRALASYSLRLILQVEIRRIYFQQTCLKYLFSVLINLQQTTFYAEKRVLAINIGEDDGQ